MHNYIYSSIYTYMAMTYTIIFIFLPNVNLFPDIGFKEASHYWTNTNKTRSLKTIRTHSRILHMADEISK